MSKEELILDGSPGARNTYIVKMVCTNCGHHNEKEIPLGETVAKREPICHNCGCRTLARQKEEYML